MTLSIGEISDRIFGTDVPFAVKAYDGSTGGNPNAVVTIDISNQRALRYLATAPGELGLARAYIMGDLVVEGIDPGDPYDFLGLFLDGFGPKRPPAGEIVDVAKSLGLKTFRVPALPAQEVVPQWRRTVEGLRGLRHSRRRDAEAIHHHYDVSNDFYELVLGPSMAYTCACYPSADSTLEQAQEHKFDLVCKKLDLRPGMRLLDIGCGWGGMVKHAVEHYGVTALGVTLSAEQASWAQHNLKKHGLDDRAEVRHGDYRDITETDFDAVSSIGLTEHIGVKNYPSYFKFNYDKLKVGGRMLNHSITRPDNKAPALTRGGFINRYVFPDGEITGVGTIVSRMQDQGFEIRHSEDLREHYAKTTRAWCKNLSANWDACVREAGEQVSRIWGLYLAGSSIGFERNHIQLHQVLGEKIAPNGTGSYPLRPDFGV